MVLVASMGADRLMTQCTVRDGNCFLLSILRTSFKHHPNLVPSLNIRNAKDCSIVSWQLVVLLYAPLHDCRSFRTATNISMYSGIATGSANISGKKAKRLAIRITATSDRAYFTSRKAIGMVGRTFGLVRFSAPLHILHQHSPVASRYCHSSRISTVAGSRCQASRSRPWFWLVLVQEQA